LKIAWRLKQQTENRKARGFVVGRCRRRCRGGFLRWLVVFRSGELPLVAAALHTHTPRQRMHISVALWPCRFVAQHDASSGESRSADVDVAACCVGAARVFNSINITKKAKKNEEK